MEARLFHPDFLWTLRRLNPATRVLVCPYCASPIMVKKVAIGFHEHTHCGSLECLDPNGGKKLRQAWLDSGLKPMPLYKVVECLEAIRQEKYAEVERMAMEGNPVALAWMREVQ